MKDNVLEAQAGASPMLGGQGCVVASNGGLGARSADGDALQEVRDVKRTVGAAPSAWGRAMEHGG